MARTIIAPPTPDNHPNPFKQGFILSIDGGSRPRPLWMAAAGSQVKFTGRWPLGMVEYSDPASSGRGRSWKSWTPFIPLSTDDSSLPVTVMEYTLENRTDKVVKGTI